MKSLFVRGCAAMSLVAAFMFFGCSDDSSPVVSDGEFVALSSSDAEKVESSSSAKLDEKAASSSSKNVSSSSAEEELSSSSKKEKKSSSSFVEDETNSSSSLENSSSSELVIVVPDPDGSIIVLSSELVGEGLLANSRLSGDDMRFKGSFSLDLTQDTSANGNNFQFTGINFKVVDSEDRIVVVPITLNPITFPTPSDIDLNSMNSAGVKVNMTDPGFTACGKYNLMVTVTASNGVYDYMSTVLIPFERNAAEYCREPYSSSSEAQTKEIPMTTCEVTVSTNLNPGLDFASCTAVPAPATTADIIFSKAGTRDYPEVTATSGNGIQFGPISNGEQPPYTDDYEVNLWPEDMNPGRSPATAYVSDFKYRVLGPTLTGMIENINQIYVAATTAYNKDTGAGFYAFAITDPSQGINGDYTLTIKVYKVQ